MKENRKEDDMDTLVLEKNEIAIDKWIHPPKFGPNMNVIDYLKFFHDTKRYFIIKKIKRYIKKTGKKKISVLEFGSGHGGLAIDIATYFKDKVTVVGYEVSPKAVEYAELNKKKLSSNVRFHLDQECNIKKYFEGTKFDVIVSCDVFGHVPDLPKMFEELFEVLEAGGEMYAFSESITGKMLVIPTYLSDKGFVMDDSEEEHISLYPVKELKKYLEKAHFENVKVYPYDPVRFLFYPKRYVKKLKQVNFPLYVVSLFLSIFQNRLTEIVYSQINLVLSKMIPLVDTAGCLVSAKKISNT